jgi:hypothetical protein
MFRWSDRKRDEVAKEMMTMMRKVGHYWLVT